MAVGGDLSGASDMVAHLRSIVGQHYRVTDHYQVGREKIREYARAVQDFHPAHWDEDAAAACGYPALLAPPTFLSLLAGTVQQALTEILDGISLLTTVQTDQIFDFHQPVLVGDELASNISLQSFRQAFGGDLFVIENAVTNQREEIVVASRTSLIARSEPTADTARIAAGMSKIIRQDLGRPARFTPCQFNPREPESEPPTHHRARKRDTVAVEDALPPRTVGLTIGDLVNYAGVSGDPNPIHWHRDAAALVGLDRGVVAHGMLTMALGAGFVTSWLGDPGALRQYRVRMTRPVYVDADGRSEIEYGGIVKSIDTENNTATIALTATHAGHKIFGRAAATVRLA
ncbi:fused (3R)-hydroxyacyl-ACP dehydratase subunits HadA/HadB [Nocardia sp. KC 131]|uniref:fused (3R)-hydroxyacyl-ACP dehydratase subunits HadA/HadB n=1 Tax=Nocardia arseniciresistens TaxID=3392119 RepID=UPI00398ED5B1